MQYFVFLFILVLMPMILTLIDRRIKGTRSVLAKLLSVVTVACFLFFVVYCNGQQILSTFKVNLKSFTNVKAFFSTRMLFLLFLLLLVLFVVFKTIFISLVFKSINKPMTKHEKAFILTSVFFDLALIPNILNNSIVFAVFGVITLVEIGLVCGRLVFSIRKNRVEEVLA